MKKNNKKIIFVGGATASGKSDLAIKLAKKYNGEIISADSRQIYKNIPIFSGAILPEQTQGVKHYLLSFLSEEKDFSIALFKKKAEEKIQEIFDKGKTPIVVGGTTFYFDALIYENSIPEVPQNKKLREKLEQKSVNELFELLEEKDKRRANQIDRKNKVRIIRALEIIETLGKVPKNQKILRNDIEIFFMWLSQPIESQRRKISLNVDKRIKEGFFEEMYLLEKKMLLKMPEDQVKKRFEKLGQAYKYFFDLKNKILSKEHFIEKMKIEEGRYAKRQNTFLKKFFELLSKKVQKKQYSLLDDNVFLKIQKDVEDFLK